MLFTGSCDHCKPFKVTNDLMYVPMNLFVIFGMTWVG